jgi:2-keto-3-deoxy-L-rhamnonate aldolase RhmA
MRLFEFRPGKLLHHGDRRIEQARGLLSSVTNPQDLQTAEDLLLRAEDLKPSGQRGMVARIKQARRYFREADNALHHIEVIPVTMLQVENVAEFTL